MTTLPLLAAAGFLAGTMNAVAGGGSFVTFPALVAAGLPGIAANASSTVALCPASLVSAWVYRGELASVGRLPLSALLGASVIGGLVGALLLLATPPASFDQIIPWLLLLACAALAAGRRAGAAPARTVRIGPAPLLALQLLIGVYGGYFGGAVGIMMMAAWSLMSQADLKAMNPAKTLLVGCMNAVAVACFVVAGEVRWTETLVMLAAGVAGGYGGARLARRLDPWLIRAVVLAITGGMTVVFFRRAAG